MPAGHQSDPSNLRLVISARTKSISRRQPNRFTSGTDIDVVCLRVEESVGANSREDIAEALEQAAILMTRHLTARAALSLTAALEPGDRTRVKIRCHAAVRSHVPSTHVTGLETD
jgi:ribosomal protein L16/L10AE